MKEELFLHLDRDEHVEVDGHEKIIELRTVKYHELVIKTKQS